MCTDTKESLRIFLTQQLGDVEEDIETISSYISCNPPETSGELLKLRELQRKYREVAASIKNEIVKLGGVSRVCCRYDETIKCFRKVRSGQAKLPEPVFQKPGMRFTHSIR
jgi:hypothetical protein